MHRGFQSNERWGRQAMEHGRAILFREHGAMTTYKILFDQVEVRAVCRLRHADDELRARAHAQSCADVGAVAQGRSRLEINDASYFLSLTLQERNQVLDHRELGGLVRREFRRPHIGNQGAGGARDLCDFGVVGGHVHRVDVRTAQRL